MRNVAILVDGDFYLKKHRRFFQQTNPELVARNLTDHCLKHIQSKQHQQNKGEDERLYRIFFYDCPPIQKKIHHPISNNLIDFSQSKTAIFRLNFHNQLRKTRNVALRLGSLDERHARWKIKDPHKEKNLLLENYTHLLSQNLMSYIMLNKKVWT